MGLALSKDLSETVSTHRGTMCEISRRIHKNHQETFRKTIDSDKVENYTLLEKWGIGAKIYRI